MQVLSENQLALLFKQFQVTGASLNSKTIKPGEVFIALAGHKYLGEQFIAEALHNGAVMILTETRSITELPSSIPVIIVPNLKKLLAPIAQFFYSPLPPYLAAITGTKGKTSVVNYFQQILALLHEPAASIGTLGIRATNYEIEQDLTYLSSSLLTTNDIITTRKILAHLASKNIMKVALEVSSQGIDQRRIESIKFNAAAFTNLGQDHLDYHHTLDRYCRTKLQLFSPQYLDDDALIILNSSLPSCKQIYIDISQILPKARIVVLQESGKDHNYPRLLVWQAVDSIAGKQQVTFTYQGQVYEFVLKISGKFQVFNIIVAILLAIDSGITWPTIQAILPLLSGIAGRLELVTDSSLPWQIFVDYAHTPESLELVLSELRPLAQGKLIVVFGCGGERDIQKREKMGEIASNLADIVIVTDDNPRTEDPTEIRQAIMRNAASNTQEIASRRLAISYAISILSRGDILLVAGRGSESHQIIGNKSIAFNDRQVIQEILSKR